MVVECEFGLVLVELFVEILHLFVGRLLHLLKHVVFVVIELFFQVAELDSQGLFLLLELPGLLGS